MKTILKPKDQTVEYPRLKCIIFQDNVADVTLFISETEGTILHHVDPTMIGNHCTDLNINAFVDYDGELVLTN